MCITCLTIIVPNYTKNEGLMELKTLKATFYSSLQVTDLVNGKLPENSLKQLKISVLLLTKNSYRASPVNSKSFIGHFFLQIKWNFELTILFYYWKNFKLGFTLI